LDNKEDSDSKEASDNKDNKEDSDSKADSDNKDSKEDLDNKDRREDLDRVDLLLSLLRLLPPRLELLLSRHLYIRSTYDVVFHLSYK